MPAECRPRHYLINSCLAITTNFMGRFKSAPVPNIKVLLTVPNSFTESLQYLHFENSYINQLVLYLSLVANCII